MADLLERSASNGVKLGKKNWLFAGSERAGKRAAAIQSLFATAKLNGVTAGCKLIQCAD
jgi:hypothetical protein